MVDIPWLLPSDPPDLFPDPEFAAIEPNGLLAIGGDLSTERLEVAYRHGIFPWYNEDQPILWWSPDPRAVLIPEEIRVSRSLRRRLRSNRFSVSFDQAFAAVIGECAESRADTGTWITPELHTAFLEWHELGHAHSVETWQGDRLAGGLYGVQFGRVFFGESMFSAVSDASKVALVALTHRCRELGIEMIDCQVSSTHLYTLGARDIPRARFLDLVRQLSVANAPAEWAQGRSETEQLTE